ncbi:peptide chain release factor N(5)-glutamine methyltransferase [Bergeyella sp. RCAD1439]|uniref:peptide chain release factor N(5)-glutamine methyltransferase n=1 Tax=Bergeyella anatis TaxID=3113737 RepID=UPI002E17153E|nr:peptide chain release factor N(5)-glutamine methyltransferase [Bergeyella sp. RCAD1439]
MTLAEYQKHFIQSLSEQYTATESRLLYTFFLQHYLGDDRAQQRSCAHLTLDESEKQKLDTALEGLKSGIPYQYLLGEAEFYGMTFKVNSEVLIPRPETEELLELALKTLKSSELNHGKFRGIDIGTGSGILPIVLKKNFPQAEIWAIDNSEKALEIAQANAQKHRTEVHLVCRDYLSSPLENHFDVIISNPPYIGQDEQNEIAPSVKNHEPQAALFSPTEDPLVFYRKIAHDALNHLNKNGYIFLEINQKFGPETLALFEHFSENQLIKDLSGNDRFVIAKK